MRLYKKRDISHTLIKTPLFPWHKNAQKGHKVLLGIGGNIGDVVRRFERLVVLLNRESLVRVRESSPLLRNPPFGYTDQADFINGVLSVETHLSPKALLVYLLGVERRLGRRRSFPDAPRTLDIDMLRYENIKMTTPRLTLPHVGFKHRESVQIPLSLMRKGGKR